jgi:hypothetical protein
MTKDHFHEQQQPVRHAQSDSFVTVRVQSAGLIHASTRTLSRGWGDFKTLHPVQWTPSESGGQVLHRGLGV